jgi:hypothetical protein
MLSGAARAEERTVDLELVLLADASGSIDETEIQFQRQGYAAAITHPQVIDVITQGFDGRIAVTYVEWGSAASQAVVVPWTIVDGADSAARFAGELMKPPRMAFGRNAIGSALSFGQRLIEQNDITGHRAVIDISADSANSWSGPPVEAVRAEVIARGTTINGLAIWCRECASGRPVAYDLEDAFARRIVGGPGHFVVTADGSTSFSEAVRKKLILEIAGQDLNHGDPGVRPRLSSRTPGEPGNSRFPVLRALRSGTQDRLLGLNRPGSRTARSFRQIRFWPSPEPDLGKIGFRDDRPGRLR